MEIEIVNDDGSLINPASQEIVGAVVRYEDELANYRTEPCRCVAKGGVERKKHTHRAHIPVGMDADVWREILADRVKHARYMHAKWTARSVARHVQTFMRTGRWMGDEIVGHVTTPRDAMRLLEADNRFGEVLNGYGVAPEHHNFCYALTAELAAQRLGARK